MGLIEDLTTIGIGVVSAGVLFKLSDFVFEKYEKDKIKVKSLFEQAKEIEPIIRKI